MGVQWNSAPPSYWLQESLGYDSVTREVSYNILIEFGIPMKLVRQIKMCLKEAYIEARISKNLSDTFTTQNGLKHWDVLSPLPFNFALEYAIR
jgi:hypothetical protein